MLSININIKIKIVELVKFHVTSDVVTKLYIYKILKHLEKLTLFLYGVFVSPHGGLGGPPSFFRVFHAPSTIVRYFKNLIFSHVLPNSLHCTMQPIHSTNIMYT
jgi:hypothetical protein